MIGLTSDIILLARFRVTGSCHVRHCALTLQGKTCVAELSCSVHQGVAPTPTFVTRPRILFVCDKFNAVSDWRSETPDNPVERHAWYSLTTWLAWQRAEHQGECGDTLRE